MSVKSHTSDFSLGLEACDRSNRTHFFPRGLSGRNRVTHKGWDLRTFHQHLIDRQDEQV